MSNEANAGASNRTIHDLTTGEEITFVETAEETGGDRLVIRLTLAPGGAVPPHAHPAQETFECLEGQLQFQLDDRTFEFDPGSTVTAVGDQIHGFRNSSHGPATMRIVANPGDVVEYGLRVKVAMLQDGSFTNAGRPKDLLLGSIVLHRSGLYMPPLPRWLYRPLIAALAALGRARGREQVLIARYPDYARLLAAVHRQPIRPN